MSVVDKISTIIDSSTEAQCEVATNEMEHSGWIFSWNISAHLKHEKKHKK